MHRPLRCAPVAAFCLLLPLVAPAQTAPSGGDRQPSVGALLGVNSTTFGGSGRNLFGVSPDRRTGLLAGVFGVLPVTGSAVAIRPEILFSMKGASSTLTNGRLGVRLSYLEVPLLLNVSPSVGTVWRPRLYAGPSVAFRTGCSLDIATAGTGASVPCSGNAQDIDYGARSVDVNGVLGAEVGRAFGGRGVGVGARYTHGFSTTSRFASVRNRALSVYASVDVSPGGRPR